MTTLRWLTLGIAGLLALGPAPSSAQIARAHAEDRPSLDYFVHHQQLVIGPGDRERLDGIGGRIMWPLATSVGRALVGGYVVHARPDDDRDNRWQFGVQADLQVGPRLLRRVDPFVSVGVGRMETVRPERHFLSVPSVLPSGDPLGAERWVTQVPLLQAGFPAERERLLTARPGIGARVELAPGIDLRTDLFRPIDLRDGTQRGLEVSGGISLRA